jgi:hypothetical protein
VESREFAKPCFVALFGEIALRVFVCDLLVLSVLWGRAIIPALTLRVFVCEFSLCVQGNNLTLPVATVCKTIKT